MSDLPTIVDDPHRLRVITLAKAVKEYEAYAQQHRDYSAGTMRLLRASLEIMVDAVGGNTKVHDLNRGHMTVALEKARKGDTAAEAVRRQAQGKNPRTGRGKGAINMTMSQWRGFIEFCWAESYLSRHVSPCGGFKSAPRSAIRRGKADPWTIPTNQWEEFLDLCGMRHGRLRMLAALGLYAGRRWSDVKMMQWQHINLDESEFQFLNEKGDHWTKLPIIFPELVDEIRRWKAWYIDQEGPLNPEWYVIPARMHTDSLSLRGGDGVTGHNQMYPGWPVEPTKFADEQTPKEFGIIFQAMDAPGKRLGMHTCRRSCAKRLIDELGWPITDVQTYLDHANVQTTEIYTRSSHNVDLLRQRYMGQTLGSPPASPVVVDLAEERWRRVKGGDRVRAARLDAMLEDSDEETA
jgi:integrase